MSQIPILTIKMVPAGVELTLHALSKLPFEQSAGLIAEVRAQAEYQLQELQKAAQASEAPAATNPSPDAEQAPSAPADPVSATANTGE